MLRPPQHRIDAPIVFVHHIDDAWDRSKIDRDCTVITGDGVKVLPELNPLAQYRGGFTRYDLNASVQEYLRASATPTRFVLRRLAWDEYQACRQQIDSGRRRDAYAYACQTGLTKIEAGAFDLEGKSPTWQEMQKLHDMSPLGVDLVHDIGQAVFQASLPMSEAEKKA